MAATAGPTGPETQPRPGLAAALAATLALAGCAELEATLWPGPDTAPRQVSVYGRSWAVWQVAETPPSFRAQRDTNALNPFGPPAMTRTRQAIAAIEAATGCRVQRPSLYQNDMGQVTAQVRCPPPPAAPAAAG